MVKPIMDIREVAKYLNFSVKKIYRLVETHRIPASRIGRQYRFLKEVIDNWLKEKSTLNRVEWGEHLDRVLKSMRGRAGKLGITPKDVEEEIKKVRASRRGNA